MAGKRKKKADDEPSFRVYELVGGPRDGDTLRLAPRPLPFIRLPFPEWCTYKWNEALEVYGYIGSQRPPTQEAERYAPQCEAWGAPLTGQNASEQYLNTEAYRRGMERAVSDVVTD